MRDVKMLSRHLRFSARFVRADIVETPSFKNVLLFTKALFVNFLKCHHASVFWGRQIPLFLDRYPSSGYLIS